MNTIQAITLVLSHGALGLALYSWLTVRKARRVTMLQTAGLVEQLTQTHEQLTQTHEQLVQTRRQLDHWRAFVAKSDLACVYCGLAKVDMNRCASGFPGCGRADDLMTEDPCDTIQDQ